MPERCSEGQHRHDGAASHRHHRRARCRHAAAALAIAALVIIAALLPAWTAPARASGPPATPVAPKQALIDAHIARHGDEGSQLVLTLTRPVGYRVVAPAAAGDPVIVEIQAVRAAVPAAVPAAVRDLPDGLISRLQWLAGQDDGTRVVIETSRPARVGSSYFMKAAERRDYQLVVNLLPLAGVAAAPARRETTSASIATVKPPPARPAAGAAAPMLDVIGATKPPAPLAGALASAVVTPSLAPKLAPKLEPVRRPAISDRPAAAPPPSAGGVASRDAGGRSSGFERVIVIDAGHGGKDPGAISVGGVYEKTITLAYAREIQRQLRALGGYRVVMTRSRDVFIPLRDRVAIARKAGADLFLSIHADAMVSPEVSGLSVYTLSERASDAEAAALADRENRVDRLGGINIAAHSPEAAGILIDVVQRQTLNSSIEMASHLVSHLRETTPILPARPHRFAGFVVLKAPDVPSVLIELGFLSNPADEKRLLSADHRRRVAAGIALAVDRYFGRVEAARTPG